MILSFPGNSLFALFAHSKLSLKRYEDNYSTIPARLVKLGNYVATINGYKMRQAKGYSAKKIANLVALSL